MEMHIVSGLFVAHTHIYRLANTARPTPYVPLYKRHSTKRINNIHTLTCVTMHFVVILRSHFSFACIAVFATDFALFLHANLSFIH